MNYIKNGDYYLPDLTIPESKPIGHYGRLRLHYLKQYRRCLYSRLIITGRLNEHLQEIDTACKEQINVILKQSEKNAPDKATDQVSWIGYMNNISHSAEEQLLSELIYN